MAGTCTKHGDAHVVTNDGATWCDACASETPLGRRLPPLEPEPMERVKLRDTITRTIQVCTEQRVGHKEAWLTACAVIDDLLTDPAVVLGALGGLRSAGGMANSDGEYDGWYVPVKEQG